jgi:hypothetical protein
MAFDLARPSIPSERGEEVAPCGGVGLGGRRKRAHAIGDNKLTLNGGWDQDLLALELGELEVLGFDLEEQVLKLPVICELMHPVKCGSSAEKLTSFKF